MTQYVHIFWSHILLSPMFQYKLVSSHPVMMLSSMMQQPLAIAESATPLGGVMSSFICGDDSTFPSVAVAWTASNESFMESTRDLISNLKIRAICTRLLQQVVNSIKYLRAM